MFDGVMYPEACAAAYLVAGFSIPFISIKGCRFCGIAESVVGFRDSNNFWFLFYFCDDVLNLVDV